ncbi:MAG TPA: tetratricopeptide repeat protein [Ktedonobacteraceae bacterium]|nr:tetratricopeptide repeat protein [Ktedonobacteraceae bacterium]
MRRCADVADCGFDNRDTDHFCRGCALPLLGTALAGRYMVEALVSKGGYAAVFRGVDQHLSRRIAIKVLLPSKTTATEQEHFLREARIAAVLDHSNIAPILDYGKDGPSVFLVMPLYTAGSLRNRLATVNGPLLAAETVTNFRQLASALFYAHTRTRPVIHRDIKPENILIHQEDRRLIITDFGIARALEPGARIGKTVTVRGTVGYMAPEQTSGVVDPRSDQFGCGVVLYEMLTGYHPFDAIGGPVRPPSMFNSELPASLDPVVLRSLSARPEDRFVHMQEFLLAFDRAIHTGSGIRISQQNPVPESRSPYVRHVTNPALPAQSASGNNGDSSARQRVVRPVNSTSAREKCLEGDQLLKLQQYAQALHAYEEALNIDPLNFHAWNGKGTALYSQGNYKRAYDSYQRATEIDSENPVVWVSAGLALNRLKRFSQSLVHFERALSIDSSCVAAWNGKADAQLDMNMPEEAIESYALALHYDAQSFQAWNGLGNARSILRDYAGAVDAYEHALMANPRSAVAWCNKAEALLRHGHTRAALDALNEATELDRSYARAWTLKADVYETLGNPQEAQKARKRARPWGLVN